MTRIQSIWDKAKKTLKFVWRHCLTLGILSIHVSVLIEASLNWKNAFFMTAVAVFLDWAKQLIKLTPNFKSHHSHSDSHATSHSTLNDQWWNPNVMGTPTYLMRNNNHH